MYSVGWIWHTGPKYIIIYNSVFYFTEKQRHEQHRKSNIGNLVSICHYEVVPVDNVVHTYRHKNTKTVT